MGNDEWLVEMIKKMKSIGSLFYESVMNHKNNIALIDKNFQVSYQDLYKRASQISVALDKKSEVQDVVAVCTEKNQYAIYSLLGIMQSGRVYLPIDLEYPEDRIKFLLLDSDAKLILVDYATHEKVSKMIREHQLKIEVICVPDLKNSSVSRDYLNSVSENDLAYLIYTSGSTGLPKGVEVEHRQLFPLLDWCNQKTMALHCLSTLQYSPLSFDPSLLEILTTLLNGKTLFLLDTKQRKDISFLLTFIIANNIERIFVPIAILNLLSEEMLDSHKIPTALREINCGGDRMVISEAIRLALKKMPGIRVNNQYGPTEASIMVTNNILIGNPDQWPQYPGLGEGIEGVELMVVDEKFEKADKGELLLSGDMLARGYRNRAELTIEKFIFLNGKRYYRTGDLVNRELNGINFLGRIDNQLKINGVRLERGEIENAIAQFLMIPQVAVEHVIDKELSYLVAFIPSRFNNIELKKYLLGQLPSAIVPNDFIEVSEFPLTSNGKINHRLLIENYLKQKNASAQSRLKIDSENEIVDVFKKVLGLSYLTDENSFFELGGTSLQAINALRLINKIPGVKITIADFYSHPTAEKILKLKNKSMSLLIQKEGKKDHLNNRQVAIVGMSCRFPHAENLESFWQLILNKESGIDTFQREEMLKEALSSETKERNYVFARGILQNIDHFDANFFDVSPRTAELFDPQMRLMLEEAVHGLEAAGVASYKSDEKIGVYVGMSNNNYLEQIKEMHPEKLKSIGDWSVALLNEKDYVATHISHKLNLRGPSLSIHTACSTSLVAIINAYRAIVDGDCDIALAGGVNINSLGKVGHLYSEGGIHSKDGQTRSFDESCSGTVFSDGVGIVVLKDLDRAIEDGDQIYALVKGAAVNNDGKNKKSFTAPSVDGQKEVVQEATLNAQIDPYTIELIEAHGTGTPVGDPIEVQALCEAWEEIGDVKLGSRTALGSVKSQIGHTVAASGVAGLIKATLAIKYKTIPASINFEKLNPLIELEKSPFYINTKNKKWDSIFPVRRAAVSSFGVGGTNAHLILEEYQPSLSINEKNENSLKQPFYLFCYSARSPQALISCLMQWRDFLGDKKNDSYSLEDLSYSLYVGRNDYEFRVSFVIENREQLISEISKKINLPLSILKTKKVKSLWGFSGQGEDCIGLGIQLYKMDSIFRESFDKCLKVLREKHQVDLWDLMNKDNELNQTIFSQPYIFSYQYSLAMALMSFGARADYFLGHSLGEYVIAVLNGIFNLEEALELVANRARLMQAMPFGSMLSVKMSENFLKEILQEAQPEFKIDMAVFNAKDLIVVSGEKEDIEHFESLLIDRGIKSKKLKTSHAFHSRMMEGVLDEFDKILEKTHLKRPSSKIVSTLTSNWEDEIFSQKNYWKEHIVKPVRFWQGLERVDAEPFDRIIDFGPRNVFSQLCFQTLSHKQSRKEIVSLSANEKGNEARQWLTGVGKLWEKDIEINLSRIFKNLGKKVSIPLYPFEHSSFWAGYDLVNNQKSLLENRATEKGLIMDQRKEKICDDLINIFAEVSGMRRDEINPDAQFLELGFDSLMLTQIALETERFFQVKVSFRQLLETYVTVNLFADYINSQFKGPMIEEVIPLEATSTSPSTLHNHYSTSQSEIEGVIIKQLELMKTQLEFLQRGRVNTELHSVKMPVQDSFRPKENSAPITEEIKATVDTAKIAFGAQAKIKTTRNNNSSNHEKEAVLNLMHKYIERTKSSKDFTQKHRSQNADPRVVTGFRPEIKEVIYPIVVNRSKDQHLWDLDNNEYIDMICGFGSNFFGNQNVRINKALHEQLDSGFEIGPQHELVGECASLICELSKMDRAAFCNTGSEAVLGALRIARAVSGRKKVVMFKGSYHGINDEVIVRGLDDGRAMPAAAGINRTSVADIIVLEYGTEASLIQIRQMANELAAVIVEPVQSRRTNFRPIEFLRELRKITEDTKTAFIFDEVITGFRIAPGGAQEYFGIRADIATYGKIIGGGMPIGVIAGSRKYLDALDGGFWQFGDESVPQVGLTYFAGTFVRHPLALRAMREALLILKEGGQLLYDRINSTANEFVYELNLFAELMGAPIVIDHFGGVLKPRFLENGENYDLFFLIMRMKGVHCYDGFPWFITLAHTDEDLKLVMNKYKEAIIEMQKLRLFPKNIQAHDPEERDYITPPCLGAKLGRDENNRPCWFQEDNDKIGKLKKILK